MTQEVCEHEQGHHHHDYLSGCCGAPEHPNAEGFCSVCHEQTMFECECGAGMGTTEDF